MPTKYCEVADVKIYFSSTQFAANSPISESNVEDIIIYWSAYINGALRNRYVLPITDESDLALLKGICARLTTGDIDEILNEKGLVSSVSKKRQIKAEALNLLEEFISKTNDLANDIPPITSIIRR